MSDLLKRAFILDTETLGLERGSPIHEVAIYNVNERRAYELIMKPSVVHVQGNSAQDLAKLSATATEQYTRLTNFLTWQETLQYITELQGNLKQGSLNNPKDLEDAIKRINPFFAKMLYGPDGPVSPHLLNQYESWKDINKRVAELGIYPSDFFRYKDVSMEKLLEKGGLFEQIIQPGSTIWIANAPFESKQFGAQLGALGPDYVQNFKSRMETSSKYADPLYVTGKEVNQARVQAQLTGDWTQVWKAYNANPVKSTEVAVRDIQDVTRAIMSYGRKLGFTKVDAGSYFGASIDLQYRLLGSLERNTSEAMSKILFEEKHRALEDASKSENYVLQKSVQYAQVLQEVSEQTVAGNQFLKQALRGEGPLQDMLNYFRRFEEVAPILQRGYALQRLERAALDLSKEGVTWQTDGYAGVHLMQQDTPSGVSTSVPRLRQNRTPFNNMQDLIAFLKQNSHYETYDVDLEEEWKKMDAFVRANISGTRTEQELISEYVQREQSQAVESYFKANAKKLISLSAGIDRTRAYSRYGTDFFREGITAARNNSGKLMRMYGVAAIGLAASGAIWSLMGGTNSSAEDRKGESLVTTNYDEWYTAKQMSENGLSAQGMAHQYRGMRTDFGSPYQGVVGSQMVFLYNDILNEREKKLRASYGAKHFDPAEGVFGIYGAFKSFYTPGYSLFNEGRELGTGELPGLVNRRGMKVIDVDPNEWSIEVEDVDTLMLKRRGIKSAIGRFFGFKGDDYTFRLEGIDSTEIWHGYGDDAWHVPQPGATKATEAMKQLIENKEIQIAFDPMASTYGRQVGTVFADNKNMNLEAVRRGLAAHLPYGKQEDAHADWTELEHAEEQAVRSNRGLWSNPWAQVYNQFVQGTGERITFNTFARKDKLAENWNTMQIVGVMEQAQAAGAMSDDHALLAKDIAKRWSAFGDGPTRFFMEGNNQAYHTKYMNELITDTTRFMATQGTNESPYRTSHTKGVGNLNAYLALDTMGSTNAVWSRRQLEVSARYGTVNKEKKELKMRMAAMQRELVNNFGLSPIGHSRM